ncbi:MAG: 30S ribosomal protein S9 [Sedimentisphaerales bacterium]
MTENPKNEPTAAKPAPAGQSTQKSEPKNVFVWGTGRRKTSVARVRIKAGKGEFRINNKELTKYFTRPQDIGAVVAPLKATDTEKSIDVFANVKGGGITGQSGAVMLGIARALKIYDPSLIQKLRDGGYLTRDGRMVERKKPGQSGARRRFQFSKR